MEIIINAKSFKHARKQLYKYYNMEWLPIRIDTYLYKFVNLKLKEKVEKELPINKVMKKLDNSFKY